MHPLAVFPSHIIFHSLLSMDTSTDFLPSFLHRILKGIWCPHPQWFYMPWKQEKDGGLVKSLLFYTSLIEHSIVYNLFFINTKYNWFQSFVCILCVSLTCAHTHTHTFVKIKKNNRFKINGTTTFNIERIRASSPSLKCITRLEIYLTAFIFGDLHMWTAFLLHVKQVPPKYLNKNQNQSLVAVVMWTIFSEWLPICF